VFIAHIVLNLLLQKRLMRKRYNYSKWDRAYAKKSGVPWTCAQLPIEALDNFLSLLPQHAKILDFGCGTGRIAAYLENYSSTVIAVDCSEVALAHATPLLRGRYSRSQSLEEFEGFDFDGVVLWGVLHHYPPSQWPIWIKQASRCVKADGVGLTGMFNSADVKFKSNSSRISATTGDLCWCTDLSTLSELIQQFFGTTNISKNIQLKDGGAKGDVRTWIYCISKSRVCDA